MRNLWLSVFLLSVSTTLFAQPMSKKGEPYLPAAGDWAVGIDAAPFFGYLGNFFSEAPNDGPTANFTNDNFAITFKKFKQDDFAYRGSVRLGILSDSYRTFSPEFSTEPTNTTVEDKYSRTITNTYLSFGLEKRKGNTRIQGFYGVEGILGFGTESHKFDYGNNITQENTNPVRSEFEILFQNDPREIFTVTETGGFITEFTKGNTFSIGARAFLGAEIFIFPKWSVGFEYGLGLGFAYTGNAEIVSEQWTVPTGGNAEQFVTTITDEGGDSRFGLDTDNSRGAVFMFFYF